MLSGLKDLIFVVLILLISLLSESSDGQIISCFEKKPFKTKDLQCADFSEVCVKQDDPDCNSFLSTCKQCPISNATIRTFVGLLKSLKDEMDKKLNESNQEISRLKTSSNEITGTFTFYSTILILVLLLVIICILLFKSGFKLFRGNKRYRNYKNEIYEDIPSGKNEMNESEDLKEMKSTENHGHYKTNTGHSGSVIKFQVQNTVTAIELYVSKNDNVVQIKRQICAKCTDTKLNYKKMQLKYKETVLNDNQYLLSIIESLDDIVHCEINDAINPSDIIVLKVHGNLHIPGLIQVNRNQTIVDLKKIISNFTNTTDIKIFKDKAGLNDRQTLENCDLKDKDSIQIIVIETGYLIMHSIVEDADPVLIGYSNTDLVSSVKKRLTDKLTCTLDEIVLYYDGKYLDKDKFIFEIEISKGSDIEYWRLLKFDRLIFATEPLVIGISSKISKATDTTSKRDLFIKMYQFEKETNWKESKAIVNELRKCKLTKSHPRFVQIDEFYFEENRFGVSVEYLGESMTKTISPLSENQIAKWSKHILEGLQVLHENKVVYLNLISSDLFLDGKNNIKMSAFGLSKYLDFEDSFSMEGLLHKSSSSTRYPAPEVMNRDLVSIHTDVWSFGAIVLKMVTGFGPYHGIRITDLTKKIESHQEFDYKFDTDVTPELQHFIKCCLKTNPKDRPTVDELLRHEFMKIHKL